MEKLIAFIPARGGSKTIPLKNVKKINGKPLIYWTLDSATKSNKINKVYVATDSFEIRKIVEEYGSPCVQVVNRSSQVSTDEASTESVMLEFAENFDFQHIILIQATSPLLTSEELDKGIDEYFCSGADSSCSVSIQKRFRWQKDEAGFFSPVNYEPSRRPLRQEWDGELVENGAFYITSKEQLLRTRSRLSGKIHCYIMSDIHLCEIDNPDDMEIAEVLLNKYKNNIIKYPKNIKLVISDVDGVLTDAGMYYSEAGDELKKFNTRDGMGFKILKEKGIKTALITTENTQVVERRAKKLKVDFLIQGCWNKSEEAEIICKKLGITLNEVAFIGDDINDLELLKSVGFSACPVDAGDAVKEVADYVCKSSGGEGCFREVVDIIS